MRSMVLMARAVLLVAYSFECHAQSTFSPSEMENIHTAMIAMNSPDRNIRDRAFDDLRQLTRDRIMPPDAQAAVINLLLRNFHETVQTPSADGGEAFAKGGGDIIQVVSSFGTRQAALALLDWKIIQTGQMAIIGVAAAGPQMAGPVTQQWDALKLPLIEGTDDDSPNVAGALVQVMTRLARQNLSAEQRAAIEQRLLAASTSTSRTVRYVSIAGLKALGDPVAKARLSAMATADPARSTPPPPREPRYFVRDAARKALQDLAKK